MRNNFEKIFMRKYLRNNFEKYLKKVFEKGAGKHRDSSFPMFSI